MQLYIDGHTITPQPGQSLLDLIRILELDDALLSKRPIAAKVAGEVFNLNYIPVRVTDADTDRTSIRRAMAASGGKIQLLRFGDPSGRDVYARTAQFILFLAIRQLWPQAKAKMNCTVGPALFIEVDEAEDFYVRSLKDQVKALVAQDIPLLRRRVSTQDAIVQFRAQGQEDKARLLSMREQTYFDEYVYGDFADYYYGELAPSTGYLQVWDILSAPGGFFFVYPDDNEPDRIAAYEDKPIFM